MRADNLVQRGFHPRLTMVVVAFGMLSGCSTYRVAPGPTVADTPFKSGGTAFEVAAEMFSADLQASSKFPPGSNGESVAATKAFKSGLAMLDLQCDRYLDAIGGANQAASNERKQVGLVGGFTSALMGLAGSAAKEIAGVATTFSFAASSMDAFTTAYLFSDAASSVTKIVRESQSAWLSAVDAANDLAQLDYPGAVALLTRYESLCRPAQIRSLIDQSIAKGTVVAETTRTSDADVGAVLNALSAAFQRPIFENDAINLYAWYKFPAERTSGPMLSSNEPVALLLKARSDMDLERTLTQAFLSIVLAGSPVPGRWEPGAQALRKVVDDAKPQPAAAPRMGGNTAGTTSRLPPVHFRMPMLTVH